MSKIGYGAMPNEPYMAIGKQVMAAASNGGYEEPGKAAEYMQAKNRQIGDYLSSMEKHDYAARMQAPSKNSSINPGIDSIIQKDMYKPGQRQKPVLEREEMEFYRKDTA